MANPKPTAKAKTASKAKKPAAKAKKASKAKAKKTAPVADNTLQVAHYIRNTNS